MIRTGHTARVATALACGLTLLCASTARASERTTSVGRLDGVLAHYLDAAGGSGSALVVDESSGRTLWSVGASTQRLPASVQKLFTTSAALADFGANARLQTRVDGSGSLSHGVWTGVLYLRGGGDPTFGSAAFDTAAYGTGATVQTLAARLRAAGIRAVKGAIVGDGSWFDADRGTTATGGAPDLELEGELSGLSYDAGFTNAWEDALQPRPALAAAQALASALTADGVLVPKTTKVYTAPTPAHARLLASVPSPTVATLAALTNAPSDNFFAETLLKDLGAQFGGAGTTASGAGVVGRTVAARFGLHPRFDDGSGLSRYDRTTAAQIVALLRAQRTDAPFVDSLAVAGESGTMVDEMLGSPAVGNCRGKTGTLHDVANLVGYCTAASGDHLIFAFFENALPDDSTWGHEMEDLMGVALAEYDGPRG